MDIDLRPILLVDDDSRDVELTLEALRERHFADRAAVASFGQFIDAVRQLGAFWALLSEPARVAQR